jgi:hypothetical protein
MKPAHISYFMHNQPGNNITGNLNGLSLQLLLNNLVRNLPGTIDRNKISVENQVPYDLKMYANQMKIVPVINELLTTVLANARNTTILLTAEKYSGIVTLNIRDSNNYNGYALSFSLRSLSQQARFAGGDICI